MLRCELPDIRTGVLTLAKRAGFSDGPDVKARQTNGDSKDKAALVTRVKEYWDKVKLLEKNLTDARAHLSTIVELIELQAMQVNKERLQAREKKDIDALKLIYKLVEVPSDGNCMYSSVSAGMRALRLGERSPQTLRNLTVVQMCNMRARVIDEVGSIFRTSAPSPTDKRLMEELKRADDYSDDYKFNVYLAIHAQPSVFAEHLQIEALCDALGLHVEVYSTRGEIMQSFGKDNMNRTVKLLLSYHTRGAHYDLLVPLPVSDQHFPGTTTVQLPSGTLMSSRDPSQPDRIPLCRPQPSHTLL